MKKILGLTEKEFGEAVLEAAKGANKMQRDLAKRANKKSKPTHEE